jgi:oleate hydratase
LEFPLRKTQATHESNFYIVGGGIASLAAAAFLIRDGDVRGSTITILEESATLGGSLDANGTPDAGYRMRGGRMLESKYLCTFDLFGSIPTMDEKGTVTAEIFEWNRIMKTSSHSRLFRDGKSIDAPALGLSEHDILTIERLELEPEEFLGRSTIEDHFEPSFFHTGFWFMWCTTFAFQRWHSAVEFKRYLVRFTHMVSGFNTLTGIMRTRYNQFDSLVLPLQRWLKDRGVRFRFNTRVLDLGLAHAFAGYSVEQIFCETEGVAKTIDLAPEDFVLVTLGSMTEASSEGTMNLAPVLKDKNHAGSWDLWQKLSARQSDCGTPSNFTDHVDQSKWVSFTVTLHTPLFFDAVRDLTGNAPGEGGLITFPESSWLASIVLPHQPHFIDQPDGVFVFWGYGLFVDKPGDFVKKPMSACSGREIMTEIIGHLGLDDLAAILESCICIPCMMPFITSQFLPRSSGDRPEVVPERSTNLAFLGQFCEMPDDVVFTVEYSIRSAQTAVYTLLGLDRRPPAVYKGSHDLRILLKALRALHEQDAAGAESLPVTALP